MPGDARAEWSVDAAAQSAFVEISGDRNPLHVDPLAARRLPFGRVAVHGMHLVLDTLERIGEITPLAPRRVRATFRHPVGIDDPLVTTLEFDGDQVRARVVVDVWTAAEIEVELEPDADCARHHPGPMVTGTFRGEPEVHEIESLSGLEGSIEIGGAAGLMALTRLVGMHVPGMHSLFSSFDVTLDHDDSDELAFRVIKADRRFAQVVMAVDGGGLSGSVTAFVRPVPVEQTLGEARPEPDEFAGQRWLVVGGSRGLGALAVLMLDAGGADVRFTYHQGTADAEALSVRTRTASAHRFDVDQTLGTELVEWKPTHLAYMASPPIFVGAAGVYSESLFERFRAIYVERFLDLVETLDTGALHGVLWPSSKAVEQPPPAMAEYADAKREGEAACRRLAAQRPELTVVTPRFPRLLTDQTTSFVPVEFGDADAELLTAVRAVTRRSQR